MDEARIDVVTVGEVLLDFVAPAADQLETAGDFLRAPGGAPANVAVAAARLGARSAFVGAVGRDPFGSYLKAELQHNGVDTSGLRTVPERTSLAFVARNQGGIPDFLFYRGADATLRGEDIPPALLARAAFVHLSSMALLTEPSRSATLTAARIAHSSDALVSVDPNLRPTSWPSLPAARDALEPLIREAEILKVNDQEARLLTGEEDLRAAAEHLAGGRRLILITLGADGCLWRWQGERGLVLAPAVEVVETTGAGDAFVGALLTQLTTRGYTGRRFADLVAPDLEDSLRFACAAGAIACTAAGAMSSLPTAEQVDALLHAV